MSSASLRTLLAVFLLASAGSALAQSPDTETKPDAATPGGATQGTELSAELFYRLLLGDVALQRGDADVAARAYIDAARTARDARLARRATEIAIASRERGLVKDAAQLWSDIDPAAERPKRVLAALAADDGKGVPSSAADDELRSRIERVLADAALSGPGVGDVFMQLNRLFAQQSDKRAVLTLVRDVARPYPKTPEAHYAVALAAFAAGDDMATASEASDEIDKALALRPDWERAALLKAEILGRKSDASAIEWLEKFIASQPAAKSATGALAQRYVERKRFTEARALMQKLWDREPESRDLEFAVAAVALQMKDYAEAERLLRDLKSANYGEPGAVDLYLAQIAEDTKQYAKAIEAYGAVTEGDRGWLAKLRIGAMYGKLGRIDDAQRWLADLPAVTKEQKVQVQQAQAQVLRDTGDDNGAYRVLTKSLEDHPDTPDLIYDLAMVAEKLDKVDEAETRLKRLVELKPDDAQALNALGYTIVDRTPRIDEGLALIERAHQLSPKDPFILDSLGWAFYRMGKLDDAERYLRLALEGRPDAEIAAHLGEVLWRKGERDQARAIWKAQLDSNPDNAVLKETVQRLAP
ncbi:MAG TPA: tetratricopeptide repeat protein [Casimicrobiaceae bacterium]|nr:tetratricopeptide repeat protein [Casimicrobiaceae bacterium]